MNYREKHKIRHFGDELFVHCSEVVAESLEPPLNLHVFHIL